MVKTVARRLVLHFPSHLIDQPVISRLIKSYNVELNILKAMITPKEEGVMVAEISGEESSYKKAIDYLKELGVSIQMLSQDIVCGMRKSAPIVEHVSPFAPPVPFILISPHGLSALMRVNAWHASCA